MGKRIIHTDQAPQAIGPYSQATELKGTLFVSGQIPINPATGELIEGNVEAQTRQVLENLKAILSEAGYDFKDVMKAEVFIADMNDFSQINGVYAEYFAKEPPARACVEVSRLPKDVKVEIALIAMKG
ncbi:2-iminobutanoate/2-iminopropanoate deaminase [Orenia metallireducens]|jgi:2-iminobutanoate/2-iminopropanoate deaminase|uniref:2-iminobutanoate/2-iminopropanoate deaminase n=1 Tax=Orenia metallireducens TaxID=1413210 RepID=A0A285HN10_9FIRM|nr:RidA family protein [Orenia metallireducens]PRX26690.1 2-iminobutanoate/2-iminopropanoate deaminase [Orenia metallireducens]SNY36146.1 2-iminobutanoate/2-iminopropanoate deaminase [Orenia metallireducens]